MFSYQSQISDVLKDVKIFTPCLSDECVFHYTQSYPNKYIDSQDQIIAKWNDPMLKINWPVDNPILSVRDK